MQGTVSVHYRHIVERNKPLIYARCYSHTILLKGEKMSRPETPITTPRMSIRYDLLSGGREQACIKCPVLPARSLTSLLFLGQRMQECMACQKYIKCYSSTTLFTCTGKEMIFPEASKMPGAAGHHRVKLNHHLSVNSVRQVVVWDKFALIEGKEKVMNKGACCICLTLLGCTVTHTLGKENKYSLSNICQLLI